MPCAGCGKRSDIIVKSNATKTRQDDQDMVTIEYIGGLPNARVIQSKVKRGVSYRFSSNPRDSIKDVFKGDAQFLLARPNEYRLVQEPEDMPVVQDAPMVVAERTVKPDISVEDLGLSDAIVYHLKKNNIKTRHELELTSDASLLAIKGIGELRLKEIRACLTS